VQDIVEHLEAVRASYIGLDPAPRGLADESVAGAPHVERGCRDRPAFRRGRIARYQLSAAVSGPGSEKRSSYRPVAFNQRGYSPDVPPVEVARLR